MTESTNAEILQAIQERLSKRKGKVTTEQRRLKALKLQKQVRKLIDGKNETAKVKERLAKARAAKRRKAAAKRKTKKED